jgi:hypothetical protein
MMPITPPLVHDYHAAAEDFSGARPPAISRMIAESGGSSGSASCA